MATLTDNREQIKSQFSELANFHRPESNTWKQYLIIKRALDFTLCICTLPVLIVLTFIIAVAIAIDSPGSPFFIQERIGKDGRRFRMYKFRTLRSNYDSSDHRMYMQAFVIGQNPFNANVSGQASFKPPLKNHVTRVGGFLRNTSLDELPQIFNVLKGEMSLIGPRPNVSWEVEKYQDWHYERLRVLPGITGLAQVRGRSAITFDDIVLNDIEYVQNQCLKLDLQIFWWTVRSVIGGEGAG